MTIGITRIYIFISDDTFNKYAYINIYIKGVQLSTNRLRIATKILKNRK